MRVGSQSLKASQQQFEELIASRNDKARAILSRRQGLFTVMGIGYRLGSNKPLPGEHRESRECRLLACDAHTVSFEDISTGHRFSEPLAHVTINEDLKHRRPLLLVTFPKG